MIKSDWCLPHPHNTPKTRINRAKTYKINYINMSLENIALVDLRYSLRCLENWRLEDIQAASVTSCDEAWDRLLRVHTKLLWCDFSWRLDICKYLLGRWITGWYKLPGVGLVVSPKKPLTSIASARTCAKFTWATRSEKENDAWPA